MSHLQYYLDKFGISNSKLHNSLKYDKMQQILGISSQIAYTLLAYFNNLTERCLQPEHETEEALLVILWKKSFLEKQNRSKCSEWFQVCVCGATGVGSPNTDACISPSTFMAAATETSQKYIKHWTRTKSQTSSPHHKQDDGRFLLIRDPAQYYFLAEKKRSTLLVKPHWIALYSLWILD